MGLKTGLGIFATLIAGLSAILSPAASQPARAEVTEEQAQILSEVADSRYDIPATEYAVLYEIPRTPYDIPEEESGVKRWMDYRAITDPTTRQWAIQQEAYTDEYGFRRYGGAYCVAVGTSLSSLWTRTPSPKTPKTWVICPMAPLCREKLPASTLSENSGLLCGALNFFSAVCIEYA